ncbi:hypothetical protein K1T71_014446 [Dendrolimus kikuchii]|uniref:Uncharacterized protein n=1 Tax=Dendrolimus kikuchii TaxID=765133 RepID=A0ACC1CEC7_9NEOP|nr:hypothetical protein K1T71_014446 [Dendrolimus kikuchii]
MKNSRLRRNHVWNGPCKMVYKEDVESRDKTMKTLLKIGREFCSETGIHGFNHIAKPRLHWIERLLWIGLVSLAAWCTFDICRGQWVRYNESPTVVTLEKDFRSWEYCLPGVTACYLERYDQMKLPQVIKKYWDVNIEHEMYAYYAKFVNLVTSSNVIDLREYDDFKDDVKLKVDLLQLAIDVMPEMDMQVDSIMNGLFNWFPVMTEMGICYTTNSVAVNDVAIKKIDPNLTKSYPLQCKYGALNCYMMVKAPDRFNNITVYPHSPYDVINIAENGDNLTGGRLYTKEMSVMESVCGSGVRELSKRRRGCLYIDEPYAKGRKVYSATMCQSTCRSRLAVELCGCRPFYYFFDVGPSCDPSGMACLSKYSHRLRHPYTSHCNCPPQCISSVFREIGTSNTTMTRASVKYSIQAPKIRYTREIVFHFHDLVVSFGGAAGLFLGASFISFVEIVYFIFEKILQAFGRKKQRLDRNLARVVPYEHYKIMQLTNILKEQEKYLKI